MGKDKEESGFGFKDKAKAEETLRLLRAHDANYRRLTVRGLLGRAKRVLSMTKAEDKIKNIKEAMAVFEEWLADLDKDKADKLPESKKREQKEVKEKEDKSSDSDTDMAEVKEKKDSGFGFKDKAKAEETIELLRKHDVTYRKLTLKGLLGRAKRVLTSTRDDTKIANIKEAMRTLEEYLEEVTRRPDDRPYLPLEAVLAAVTRADHKGLDISEQKEFIAAYEAAKGDHNKLCKVPEKPDGRKWDVVRNAAIDAWNQKFAEATLFDSDDFPSDEHLQLILWAYSPEASKVKNVLQSEPEVAVDTRKRKSSGGDGTPNKKQK